MSMIYPLESKAVHPRLDEPGYASSVSFAPKTPLILLAPTLSELTGPVYGHDSVREHDFDLTRQHDGVPMGEKIIVHGKVLDEDGRPVPDTLVEIWQANASGRYIHVDDQGNPPLDPNFDGTGRVVTDADGGYKFITIKPGAYSLGGESRRWRPAHIHVSLFGTAFASRLVTQMYFPGDPLQKYDPIFQSIHDEQARNRLVATLDLETSVPGSALAYRFDYVLRGRNATPQDND
jgi:protocatechuate 3,4-dioxygenase beta subunit